MKIIVIGATGTIGQAVVKLLASDHEIVKVSRNGGDFQADIASRGSIEKLFQDVDAFDAVVCATGGPKFGTLDELTDDDYMHGLTDKLMGQANVVRIGRQYINDNGSFTLRAVCSANGRFPAVHPLAWRMRASRVLYERPRSRCRSGFG